MAGARRSRHPHALRESHAMELTAARMWGWIAESWSPVDRGDQVVAAFVDGWCPMAGPAADVWLGSVAFTRALWDGREPASGSRDRERRLVVGGRARRGWSIGRRVARSSSSRSCASCGRLPQGGGRLYFDGVHPHPVTRGGVKGMAAFALVDLAGRDAARGPGRSAWKSSLLTFPVSCGRRLNTGPPAPVEN
jgi:hypothetical protein